MAGIDVEVISCSESEQATFLLGTLRQLNIGQAKASGKAAANTGMQEQLNGGS